MDITLVKKLRSDTGLSIKDCTKAVKETDNYDDAILYLRQRNKDVHDKRAEKEVSNGTCAVYSDSTGATLIILGCETDFVSGNEKFKKYAHEICRGIHTKVCRETINESLVDIGGEFGENVQIVEEKSLNDIGSNKISVYNHGNIAVAVSGIYPDDAPQDLLRTVAMHIAASSPLPRALNADGLESDFISQEKSLIEGSEDVQSKPENIRDKIVTGKMNKVYKTYCLLEQEMLTAGDDTKQSVGKWASANDVVITGFELVSMK